MILGTARKILLLANDGVAPIVEQDTGTQTTGGATSDTATFAVATVTGRGIIVVLALKGARQVSTITDNKGNTYVRVGRAADSTDCSVEMWYCQPITGGASHTITVTFDGTTYCVWGALEASRVKGGGAFLDTRTVNTATRGGSGSSAAPTVTSGLPRSANELFVAMVGIAGGGADAGIQTPTNWTNITLFQDYDGTMAGHGDRRINVNANTVSATWPNSTTTSPYAAIIAGFRGENAISGGTSPPVNTVLPAITGTATEGETLTASTGTWSNSPTSYTYQWYANGVAISGAVASTYVLTAAEIGTTITVKVTAYNEGNAGVTATSAATSTVGASTDFVGAFVKLSASDTRDWRAGVAIPWTGTDDVDAQGWHDPSSNNTRLTVPSGYGITRVRILARVKCELLAINSNITLKISKNGSTSFDDYAVKTWGGSSAAYTGQEWFLATPSMPATAGDYFEIILDAGGTGDSSIMLDTTSFAVIEATHRTGDTYSGANVTKSGDSTGINATSGHTIAWDSELDDTGGWHDNVTNNTRLTVPSGVTRVRLSLNVHVQNIASWFYLRFNKNGSNTYEGMVEAQWLALGGTGLHEYHIMTGDIPVSAGDYFEAIVFTGDSSIDILSQSKARIEAVSYSPDLSAVVTASATQVGNFTTAAALTFNTETRDVGGWHDNVTNNTRLTVPSGSNISHVDLVACCPVSGITDIANTQYGYLEFVKNGTTSYVGYLRYSQHKPPSGGTAAWELLANAYSVPCQAGDYFEVFHGSGADTSVTCAATRTFQIRATRFDGTT